MAGEDAAGGKAEGAVKSAEVGEKAAANGADGGAVTGEEGMVLEEDDDFEEFEEDNWEQGEFLEEDQKVWFDDWDDEEAADAEFVARLRKEIERNATAGQK